MATRLNITIDEDLYRRLKVELPPRGLSAFINAAVRARLRPDRASLDAAYRSAQQEAWRTPLGEDWAVTDVEAWPE